MHIRSYILGNVSVPPTERQIRRFRRRFCRDWNKHLVPTLVCLFPFCLLVLFLLSHSRHSKPSSSTPPHAKNGLLDCLASRVSTLNSFDPFVLSEKALGIRENDIENRFQEDVWDTILHKYALFPAWSDMTWNVPQYARGLAADLAILQALASKLLGFTSGKNDSLLLEYLSGASPVIVNYVHHRLDRFRGLQYLVNFSHRKQGAKQTTYNLLVEKSLDELQCRISLGPGAFPNEPVYVLLPYKSREQRLRLFFENLVELRTTHNQNIIVIVSILRGSDSDKQYIQLLKTEMPTEAGDCVWLHENDGDISGDFSRGVALREAAKMAIGENAVVFHCDVDMIIRPSFLDRCRQNTRLRFQVYYPVFYSLYPYANAAPSIRQRNGFWRTTSFGMTCMRKGDFERVGAFEDAESRFHGWGSEDVWQFEKVRNQTGLVAFRAVEPGLLHRWHSKKCDVGSAAYVDCMKTNFATMGHPIRVGPALLKSLNDVNGFFERLQDEGNREG